MKDRFTERAKDAIRLAHEAAAELGHCYVGSEHIIIGLMRKNSGVAYNAMINCKITESVFISKLVGAVGHGEPGQAPLQGLTPRAKHIIDAAAVESRDLGNSYIGTEHILLAILRETDCMAVKVLSSMGTDIRKLYTDTAKAISAPVLGGYPIFSAGGDKGVIVLGRNSEQMKTLLQYGRDLIAAAKNETIDPVIGREKETARMAQILSRRKKNNPVLIGEPGVGKTAVVEGLALAIANKTAPEVLHSKIIISVDLSAMVAGTKYRGEFEERFRHVMEEAKKAGNVVLFIDEMHVLSGAGAAEGAIDAASILKPALARGEIQIIGATTIDEYRKHIEKDAALERRFQPIMLLEPSEEDTFSVLMGLRDKYEAFHGLKISEEAVRSAVSLSVRYISDRFLPDKAIDLIDEACAYKRLSSRSESPLARQLKNDIEVVSREKDAAVVSQEFARAAELRLEELKLQQALLSEENAAGNDVEVVVPEDIAAVVSEWSGVPLNKLTESESEKLLLLEETLRSAVVGQDEAVSAVSKALRRARSGLKDPSRPMGSFIFCGPSGVGKTQLCRALANALFGNESALIKLDMSEYMEKHAVSKLIGAPPGYIGHENSGYLTEKIRRKPFSLVLFDEIEKAHPDIFNLLLQITEDGTLTDSHGRRVDFKNTLIILTCNIGAKIIGKAAPLGFLDNGKEKDSVMRESVIGEVKKVFSPEFLGRIDDIIVFNRLKHEDIEKIAEIIIEPLRQRLQSIGVNFTVDSKAMKYLSEKGFREHEGARYLRRLISSEVEDVLAEKILSGVKTGQLTVVDGVLGFYNNE